MINNFNNLQSFEIIDWYLRNFHGNLSVFKDILFSLNIYLQLYENIKIPSKTS